MSRTLLPFHSGDISALARALSGQLARCDHQPGHVELLNMLARSAGFRNFQHFRATTAAGEEPAGGGQEAPPVDLARLRRLARLFDETGRLRRWPTKLSHQQLCLWVLWSRLPPRQIFSEAEINHRLQADHLFGDHALLRRWLCDYGMATRTTDGRQYRRVEKRPPADALALIRQLKGAASTPPRPGRYRPKPG